MRRKQSAGPGIPNGSVSSPPLSPASTGAMDSLLEKLRAAAPQARDQRDRRRRARLKDRHQTRVASGQKIPDLSSDKDSGDEGGPLSPDLGPDNDAAAAAASGGDGTGAASASVVDKAAPEREDVADRAASLLQGLRGDAAGDSGASAAGRDDSARVWRRRDSADDERARRRRRRAAASAAAAASAEEKTAAARGVSTIIEEPGMVRVGDGVEDDDGADGTPLSPTSTVAGDGATPTTIVSPPSPVRATDAGQDGRAPGRVLPTPPPDE